MGQSIYRKILARSHPIILALEKPSKTSVDINIEVSEDMMVEVTGEIPSKARIDSADIRIRKTKHGTNKKRTSNKPRG